MYGDKADDIATANQDTLNKVTEKIPTLKGIKNRWKKNGKIKYINKTKADDANTGYILTKNNKLLLNPIKVYNGAFKSYKYLARTLFHEFVHVGDLLYGKVGKNLER